MQMMQVILQLTNLRNVFELIFYHIFQQCDTSSSSFRRTFEDYGDGGVDVDDEGAVVVDGDDRVVLMMAKDDGDDDDDGEY